jgi:hypothetical protein
MPHGPTEQFQEFAKHVLACEAALIEEGKAKALDAFQACDKLRIQLRKIFGSGGFRPLLHRALVLAGAKTPWLCKLRTTPDGALDGFAELPSDLDRSILAEGEIALIAELLGLLVTFVGPALTLSLVQDIWPALEDLKLENGTL